MGAFMVITYIRVRTNSLTYYNRGLERFINGKVKKKTTGLGHRGRDSRALCSLSPHRDITVAGCSAGSVE